MATDASVPSGPSNPCCADVKRKYEDAKASLKRASNLIERNLNSMKEDKLKLKLEKEAKKKERVIRKTLENDIHELKAQIASLSQETKNLLEADKSGDELDRVKQLLEEERKRTHSEKMNAANAWNLLQIEKGKVEEERGLVQIERARANELSASVEKVKREFGELRDHLAKRVEEEKQKANREKRRADAEKAKLEEQKKYAEREKMRALEEKSRADSLLKKLEEEREKTKDLLKKLQEERKRNKGSDWAELPLELIQIIANKLPDLFDFVRFRATCKTWHSSVPLSDPPPQFPWFIELNGDIKGHRFYSVSSGQTLTIHLTQSECLWKWINYGVFSHYLAFVDICEDTLSFLNPLTNDRFSLPWPSFSPSMPRVIWTGTDPIRNRRIVVVDELFDEVDRWACYDPHSNKWVEQEVESYNSCYWQGMFFSTSTPFSAHVPCTTEVFDASSNKVLHEILPPENERRYIEAGLYCVASFLVESLGRILRVSWFNDDLIVEDSIVNIYRLDFDGLDGQPSWVRVDNIGNQILFLQETSGFSMTARPSTGFREGCIYFINPEDEKPYVHDILAGTFEMVPCPFETCTWFLPSL